MLARLDAGQTDWLGYVESETATVRTSSSDQCLIRTDSQRAAPSHGDLCQPQEPELRQKWRPCTAAQRTLHHAEGHLSPARYTIGRSRTRCFVRPICNDDQPIEPGIIRQLLVDDKGTVLIAVFGVPPFSHEDDALRGTRAAMAMQTELYKLGFLSAIGVTYDAARQDNQSAP